MEIMLKKSKKKSLRQPFHNHHTRRLTKHDLGTIDTYLFVVSRDFALTPSLLRNLKFCPWVIFDLSFPSYFTVVENQREVSGNFIARGGRAVWLLPTGSLFSTHVLVLLLDERVAFWVLYQCSSSFLYHWAFCFMVLEPGFLF